MTRKLTTPVVDTGKAVTLRPLLSWILLFQSLVFCPVALGFVFAIPDGSAHLPLSAIVVLGLGITVPPLWFGFVVCVRPAGLVARKGFSRRKVGWDEIDGVRLDVLKSCRRVNRYAPVLELRSGAELLLGELSGLSTERRLARSSPARQVEIIGRYLNDHRQHGRD